MVIYTKEESLIFLNYLEYSPFTTFIILKRQLFENVCISHFLLSFLVVEYELNQMIDQR